MNKKNNKKGFTLAELLIVVAMIAVLVAVAIPIFTKQLEKSREATDLSNVRSAYAEVITQYLDSSASKAVTVKVNQKIANWQCASSASTTYVGTSIGSQGKISVKAKTSGNYTVKISKSGTVTVD